RPRVHMPCMVSAFALDLGLVLYIELTRHAIAAVGKAVQRPLPHGLLLFHVAVSLLVLVLYGLQLWLGSSLFKGREDRRTLHRNLGIRFVVFRLTNYVTSMFVAGGP